MISQEDFSVISRLDSGDQASRDKVVKNAPIIFYVIGFFVQVVCFFSELTHFKQ